MSIFEELRNKIPDTKNPIQFVLEVRKQFSNKDEDFWIKLHSELEYLIGIEECKKLTKVLKEKKATIYDEIFDKILSSIYNNGYKLLTGNSLEEAIIQYEKYISHVEKCWSLACEHYKTSFYNISIFFSILTLEETGKLTLLWTELLNFQPNSSANQTQNKKKNPLYSHYKKHLLASVQGALVNSRLDQLVGIEALTKLFDDASDGTLEIIRQNCIYCDNTQNGILIPSEIFSQEEAAFYLIVSGEIMADILGCFPWEFERLINKVKIIEQEIGIFIADKTI